MDRMPVLKTVRFETEGIDCVEAGVDFRAGTRLYDSAVTGRIHLYLNGDERRVERRLPDEFDISATVNTMFDMCYELEMTGSASARPFCCICGYGGCAGLEWRLETVNSEAKLVMEDAMINSTEAHRYHLLPETLYSAVAELVEMVIAAMDDTGVTRTTAGTIQEFVDWHEQLVQWTESKS